MILKSKLETECGTNRLIVNFINKGKELLNKDLELARRYIRQAFNLYHKKYGEYSWKYRNIDAKLDEAIYEYAKLAL